jgi:hypothetical protein
VILTSRLTKLRRFLRDPDGEIWTDTDLLTYWNDAQVEIAQKTLILSKVEAHHYPPEYTYAYTHDWEKQFVGGDRYCPFEQSMTRAGLSFCHSWESAYYLDTVTTPHDGYRITHPWEGYYAAPDGFIPVLLHEQLDRMVFCAYGREKLDPATRKEIGEGSIYYRTQTGSPTNYWRIDEFSNQVALYPHPSMVLRNFSRTETIYNEYPDELYFEDGYFENEYFETVIQENISSSEEWLDQIDTGIITDIIYLDDSLFMVYQFLPSDIVAWDDDIDLPPWFVKAIECAALERAYSADTDGFIPSLRDYWKVRKELHIKLIAKFKNMRLADRDFVIGAFSKTRGDRHGRLPGNYPAR